VKFIRFAFIAGEDTQIFTIFKCEIMDMEKLISAVFVRGPLCDQKTKNHSRFLSDKLCNETAEELKKTCRYFKGQMLLMLDYHHHHHHHHHWLDNSTWALAFLRSFCQLKYPAIASSDFVTRVFSRVWLSAPLPTPGYPGESKFSVSVVSLSRLVLLLKRQDLAFCPCMT
jgi:hypothetical protein